ncbi:MAG: aminotransferase class I/II-fold pyridoxal phosphate-dependent enzyme [Candidatus Omnitrophota bacterium]
MNKKIRISKKVEEMRPSGIREFFDLVIGMRDVISLGVGEPDFVTPWNICESVMFSLEKGYTSYTSNKGLYELRLALSRHIKGKFSVGYDPDDDILITTGVSEAIDLALRSIVNKGDKVLIPSPSYVAYEPVAFLAGAVPVIVRTDGSNNFKLTPDLIKKNLTSGAKAIVINYPCNPTGSTYTKKELLELSRVFIDNNLIVISDEAYDELTYDFNHTPIASLPGMRRRTVYLNGFSKAYAMTGWRIGYACGPKEIIAGMTKIHQYTMLCAPIMGQMGAIEALKGSGRSVIEMRREYMRRREFVVDKLNEMGLECHRPDGAFYAFPSIRSTGMDCRDFAKDLLKKEKVALVPGTAFGMEWKDRVRISYASSLENLKEAMERIGHFLKAVN